MTEYVFLFSALAFSVLISGDLAASSYFARRAGHERLIQALDVVFWSSWVGLFLLPTCIVLKLLENGIDWTERCMLSIVGGTIITVAIGLWFARHLQRNIREDFKLQRRIELDKRKHDLDSKLS